MLVHQVDPVVACLQIHVVMSALSRFGVCHAYILSALEGFDDVVYIFGFDMLNNFLAVHKVNSSLYVLLREVEEDCWVDAALNVVC